jgi:hypothetical protein
MTLRPEGHGRHLGRRLLRAHFFLAGLVSRTASPAERPKATPLGEWIGGGNDEGSGDGPGAGA